MPPVSRSVTDPQQTGPMASSWRSRFRSIRTRIVVGYVVLVAIALLITVVIARSALIARYDNDVDNRLAAEVDQLQLVIAEGDPETGRPFTDAAVLFETHLQRVLPGDDAAFFTLVDGDPFQLSFGAPDDLLADPQLVDAWATTAVSSFKTVTSNAGPARTLIVPVVLDDTSGTFVAAVFTQDARDDLDDIFRTLALVGAVTLLGSAVIALIIASQVVRPIRDLTILARSVTDADMSARIPVEGDDELAELSTTFNDMMSRLEHGFAAQREFLDDVAHELRTPITIIQGHLDVLDDDPTERAETVAVLHDELDRMNRYVDDLLVLAQAERPDFLRVAGIDLDVLASKLLGKASAMAERTWTLDETTVGVADLDEQRITQAVLNLVHNAVRHTEVGDEIGIGVHLGDTTLTLRVRDTGTGVDPAVVDDLFVRHIRSAASRTAGGTGLGLSIVDAIAVAHGGTVSLDPTSPDAGATFTITIPVPPSIGVDVPL
jgi:two-component system OmpR family sensor kinase